MTRPPQQPRVPRKTALAALDGLIHAINAVFFAVQRIKPKTKGSAFDVGDALSSGASIPLPSHARISWPSEFEVTTTLNTLARMGVYLNIALDEGIAALTPVERAANIGAKGLDTYLAKGPISPQMIAGVIAQDRAYMGWRRGMATTLVNELSARFVEDADHPELWAAAMQLGEPQLLEAIGQLLLPLIVEPEEADDAGAVGP